MSLQWLTLFILISSYFIIVCLKAESPCHSSGFNGSTSYVCGVIGESVTLTCNVPKNCSRGLWKYDNTTGQIWVEDNYPNYLKNFNFSEGLNSLNIENISDSVAGFYTCSCDGYNITSNAFACFKLSVNEVQCDISVHINNENRILDTCRVTGEVEVIELKVNDNISIRCGDKMKRKTDRNCPQKGTWESFTVKMSHHLCNFNCEPKRQRNDIPCKTSKRITLNVTDYITLSSAEMTPFYSTQTLSSSAMTSSCETQTLSFSQSFLSVGPSEQNTRTTNKNSTVKTTGAPSPSSVTFVPTSSGHLVPDPDKKTTVLIIVVSCIVFVLSFIVLILCVHIIFYKKDIRSCNNKEEWVNPLYETADNRAELPIVIPDGGNLYNAINSPDHVTKFSRAEGASNNVHKIYRDLGRTNELPMVQLKASENVGITVTPFGAHSMELNKPRCKQLDTSLTAAHEALNVPNVGDISPPPASPHLYEMFK